MTFAQLAKVLLVQACEERDPGHTFILRYERELPRDSGVASTHIAGEDPLRAGEARVLERAEHIVNRLTRQHPVFASAFTVLQIKTPLVLLIGCAVLGGILADPIGPAGHINLLNVPLLTLLIWNAVIYAGVLYNMFMPRSPQERSQPGVPRFVEWLLEFIVRGRLSRLKSDRAETPEEIQWIATSLASYAERLLHHGRTLLITHAHSLLHLAAAALAIGMMVGLYLRGFTFLYRAGWDSTFLEATGVHALLSFVFAPASWLVGISVPSVDVIADQQGPAKANAAMWIHLWAATTVLFIVLPRTVLAMSAWLSKTRLAAEVSLPSNEPYFQRLLNPYRGNGLFVEVLAYSHRVKEADDRLLTFLSDAFGVLADIHIGNPVSYGERPPEFSSAPDRSLCAVVLLNVAQAPEETHSEFLEELKATIRGRGHSNMLLVALDCEAYAKIEHEKRLQERCQAWATLVSGCGMRALTYRNPFSSLEKELRDVSDCLWPRDFREAR